MSSQEAPLPRPPWQFVAESAGAGAFAAGRALRRAGGVRSLRRVGGSVTAQVASPHGLRTVLVTPRPPAEACGSEAPEEHGVWELDARCQCQRAPLRRLCEHVCAVMLAWRLAAPSSPQAPPEGHGREPQERARAGAAAPRADCPQAAERRGAAPAEPRGRGGALATPGDDAGAGGAAGPAWMPRKRQRAGLGAPGEASPGRSFTPAQCAVLELVRKGRGLFLTGAAGTGKSLVLREAARQARGLVALTAPTGSAAVLLGGQTVHSWSGVGCARAPREALVGRVLKDVAACDRWQSASLLVIDEVSMVSGQLLDVLDAVGRAARRCPGRPFGGLQVLLAGDFHQLPPPECEAEGWAFEARCWDEAVEVAVELTEVLRADAGEAQLVDVLGQVRRGVVDDAAWAALERIVARPRDPARALTEVVPTNRRADGINEAALARLTHSRDAPGTAAEVVSFGAQYHGPDGGARAAPGATSVPPLLRLCRGARVVLTRSVCLGPLDEKFPNGTQCQVTGFVTLPPHLYDPRAAGFDAAALGHRERHFVARHGGALPRVAPVVAGSEDGRDFVLYPVTLEDAGGAAVQLPARLGWALTAHRAQGLTLEGAAVHLRGLFCPGQAYVALSRCRRAADLWIEGLPRREPDGRVQAFAPHAGVAAFYARLRGAQPVGPAQ